MTRLMKRAAVVFVIVFAAAQLVRSEHSNPGIDPSHTLRAQLGSVSGLVTVVDRAPDIETISAAAPRTTKMRPCHDSNNSRREGE
jgi:hypothetical protein